MHNHKNTNLLFSSSVQNSDYNRLVHKTLPKHVRSKECCNFKTPLYYVHTTFFHSSHRSLCHVPNEVKFLHSICFDAFGVFSSIWLTVMGMITLYLKTHIEFLSTHKRLRLLKAMSAVYATLLYGLVMKIRQGKIVLG